MRCRPPSSSPTAGLIARTVSRMSAALPHAAFPHAASRRTTAPCLATSLSRADVVRSRAVEGLVNGCGWHGRQAGQGPTCLGSTDNEVRHIVTCGRPRCGAGESRPPACRVGLGQVAGDRLGSRAGVALQRAHRGVPGSGQQQREVGAVLSGVGEGRVAQLVQRPSGAHAKQFGGSPVRQPGPPACRV
jgi:hypothetical protein